MSAYNNTSMWVPLQLHGLVFVDFLYRVIIMSDFVLVK